MNLLNRFLVAMLLKVIKGGENDMVAVYSLLIMKGLRTFESVPENLQPAVAEYLEAMELGLDGQPLNN